MTVSCDQPLYTYTARNLLEKPEYYFYSAFSGPGFLDAYQRVRADGRERLRQMLDARNAGGNGVPPDVDAREADIPVWRSLPRVDTKPVLRAVVHAMQSDRPLGADSVRWLDEFLKRFEVSKKLYAVYSDDMRRVGDDVVHESCYVLLSFALVTGYVRTAKLKWLNGALKLNDVVCSLECETLEADDLVMAIAAIDGELRCVQALASRHGVSL